MFFKKCHFFLTVCAGQVIKSTIKRVDNSSVDLLPRVLKNSVKFNQALKRKWKKKEGSRRSMMPRDKVCGYIYIYMC